MTAFVCPLRSSRGMPVRASQTFAIWSALPVTINAPSGEKLTLLTAPVCPLRSSRGVPVRASQTFAVLSQLPVTIRAPSGEKLTLRTRPVGAQDVLAIRAVNDEAPAIGANGAKLAEGPVGAMQVIV